MVPFSVSATMAHKELYPCIHGYGVPAQIMTHNPPRDRMVPYDLLPVAVRDKAYVLLKRALVRGELRPGHRIIETQLADIYKISRTPLREAILKLESEGFLERLPSGVRVKPLHFEEMRELYAVRSVLEGLAAREATEHLSQEQLRQLHDLTHDLEAADRTRANYQEIVPIGERFHGIILEASGDQILASYLRLSRDQISRYRHLTIEIPGRGQAAAAEHISLLEVLERRDPEEAERVMRRHVLAAWESIKARLVTEKFNPLS